MNRTIIDKINRFTEERNWEQFHSGENLAKALIIEAAELLEKYQWKQETEDIEGLKEELADVFLYAIMIAEKYGFDIDEIINAKIDKNARKYPVAKAYGKSDKYSNL
jgi:NTP pyrophosphatase (non-canonical NTP hydrolase)